MMIFHNYLILPEGNEILDFHHLPQSVINTDIWVSLKTSQSFGTLANQTASNTTTDPISAAVSQILRGIYQNLNQLRIRNSGSFLLLLVPFRSRNTCQCLYTAATDVHFGSFCSIFLLQNQSESQEIPPRIRPVPASGACMKSALLACEITSSSGKRLPGIELWGALEKGAP